MIGRRRKASLADARRRLEDAKARAAASKVEADVTKLIVAQSQTASERLRREFEKNGWTELLQNAWGAR